MAVHPHLPVVLSSDGYLVTVMQLPSLASYHGIMTRFMRDITRYVQVQVKYDSCGVTAMKYIAEKRA